MKRCPQCSRTFSDDTLSFCLEDGALLSRAYDSEETLVMGADDPTVVRATSPDFDPKNEPATAFTRTKQTLSAIREIPASKTSPHLIYAGAGLLAVVIIAGSAIWFYSNAKDGQSLSSNSRPVSIPTTNVNKSSDSTPETNTPVDEPSPITVPLLNFASANWDRGGPEIDRLNDRPPYLWMATVGQITYQPTIQETKKGLVVIARLSSELDNRTSVSRNDSSDVDLIVNGQNQGRKNVIPDNLVGRDYEWFVPNETLRKGVNEITFKVGGGESNNGLTIYGPIQLKFQASSSAVNSSSPANGRNNVPTTRQLQDELLREAKRIEDAANR